MARRAGFALCTAAHEDRASAEHFGPDMWNVPVATRWEEIDGSLVDARRGGFDAYAAEGAEAGRPTFAGKLLLYHRGEGEARKVGYFTAEKAEELLWRFCASVTAPLVRPAAARIERAYSAAEDGVRRARAIADEWAGPLLDGSAAPARRRNRRRRRRARHAAVDAAAAEERKRRRVGAWAAAAGLARLLRADDAGGADVWARAPRLPPQGR